MKPFFPLMCLVVAAAMSTVACDKLKPPSPELQKPPASSGQASPQEGARTTFTDAAQKELDELKVTIVQFKAKAEASDAQAKARLGEEVTKLEADLRDAQERLTGLKAATLESWDKGKAAFSSSLERLKTRVEYFRKNDA